MKVVVMATEVVVMVLVVVVEVLMANIVCLALSGYLHSLLLYAPAPAPAPLLSLWSRPKCTVRSVGRWWDLGYVWTRRPEATVHYHHHRWFHRRRRHHSVMWGAI